MRLYILLFILLLPAVLAVEDTTPALNTRNILYAGFGVLSILLLVTIVWGIVQVIKGSFDLMTLALTAVGGAIVLILAYILVYNIAATYFIITDPPPEDPPLIQSINNIRLCADNTLPCKVTGLNDTIIYLYWTVDDGVGCCKTFGCNYDAFIAFCGTPFTEFKLYDLYIDTHLYVWNNSRDEWNYTCSDGTPWNYFYYNYTLGLHNITIYQKDCQQVVDIQSILFFIIPGEGGKYDIEQV